MRNTRISYGKPVYWTLENLQETLFKILSDGVAGDSLVLLHGCDCCTSGDEGGIEVKRGVNKDIVPDKVVHVKRYAGFVDNGG